MVSGSPLLLGLWAMRCPKCHSPRVQRGYHDAPLPVRSRSAATNDVVDDNDDNADDADDDNNVENANEGDDDDEDADGDDDDEDDSSSEARRALFGDRDAATSGASGIVSTTDARR